MADSSTAYGLDGNGWVTGFTFRHGPFALQYMRSEGFWVGDALFLTTRRVTGSRRMSGVNINDDHTPKFFSFGARGTVFGGVRIER